MTGLQFRTIRIFLSSYQSRLADCDHAPYHPRGMALVKMTSQEIEALLRLLVAMERE